MFYCFILWLAPKAYDSFFFSLGFMIILWNTHFSVSISLDNILFNMLCDYLFGILYFFFFWQNFHLKNLHNNTLFYSFAKLWLLSLSPSPLLPLYGMCAILCTFIIRNRVFYLPMASIPNYLHSERWFLLFFFRIRLT